jgi:GNAT superfamily N-acetyltransferase
VSELDIRPIRFGAPVARTLVDAAMAELAVRYNGSGDETPIQPGQFDPPGGCFLVAWLHGEPVACGGWRNLGYHNPEYADDVAELKRMYAVPAVRGTGVATALLRALEENARERGMHRLLLETGTEQPEAIRFYTRLGYQPVDHFGYYKNEPGVVSLGREL